MFSSYCSTKIEVLNELFKEGYFNSSRLYRHLENMNKLNKQLWIEGVRKDKQLFGIPFYTKRTLTKRYDKSFKDWKAFKKEAFDTSFNKLSQQQRYDFIEIDKLLACVVICKNVCDLHNQTGGNPVQVDVNELRAINYVLRRTQMLGEYQFDFTV